MWKFVLPKLPVHWMYIISELVDILNKISDVNIWQYCQGMFVAEYWNDWWTCGPLLEIETSGGRQATRSGTLIYWTLDIFVNGSNGCSSSYYMHLIGIFICGSGLLLLNIV